MLAAHIRAGGDRFRGIRHITAWDADASVRNPAYARRRDLLARRQASARASPQLAPLGLSLRRLALPPADRRADRPRARLPGRRRSSSTTSAARSASAPTPASATRSSPPGRASIRELAACPNVCVKLGGLGMRISGFGFHEQADAAVLRGAGRGLAALRRDLHRGLRRRRAACSRATSRSTRAPTATRCSGTPASSWPRAQRRRESRPFRRHRQPLLPALVVLTLPHHCEAGGFGRRPQAVEPHPRIGQRMRDARICSASTTSHPPYPTACANCRSSPPNVDAAIARHGEHAFQHRARMKLQLPGQRLSPAPRRASHPCSAHAPPARSAAPATPPDRRPRTGSARCRTAAPPPVPCAASAHPPRHPSARSCPCGDETPSPPRTPAIFSASAVTLRPYAAYLLRRQHRPRRQRPMHIAMLPA